MFNISIDGLIAIARKGGLESYSFDCDGQTCKVLLRTKDGDKREVFTRIDAIADGVVMGRVWAEHPARMLRVYALKKSFNKHFGEVIARAERNFAEYT